MPKFKSIKTSSDGRVVALGDDGKAYYFVAEFDDVNTGINIPAQWIAYPDLPVVDRPAPIKPAPLNDVEHVKVVSAEKTPRTVTFSMDGLRKNLTDTLNRVTIALNDDDFYTSNFREQVEKDYLELQQLIATFNCCHDGETDHFSDLSDLHMVDLVLKEIK